MDVLLQALALHRMPDDRSDHNARMRLALALGVSFYTVEHWRTGRRPIGAAMRQELAHIIEELTRA